MGPVAAVIGAVATVGGTVMQMKAQKKAAAASRRQQDLSTQRSNRQSIREAQLQRAQAVAVATPCCPAPVSAIILFLPIFLASSA